MNIVRKLTEKPWLQQGPLDELPEPGAFGVPTAKIGLWVFLAVVTSLFGLFLSAYTMRMEYTDWRPLAEPGLLWVNTLLLLLASLALQTARSAARQGHIAGLRAGLTAGGALTVLFLVGQAWAWQQLDAAGYFAATNPANSFYFLLTGVHGLHLAGGLWVWARMMTRVYSGLQDREPREVGRLRLSIELCATYWHFLLLVWLVLFGLLLST